MDPTEGLLWQQHPSTEGDPRAWDGWCPAQRWTGSFGCWMMTVDLPVVRPQELLGGEELLSPLSMGKG